MKSILLVLLCVSASAYGQSSSTRTVVLAHVAAEPARNDFAVIAAKIRTTTDTAAAYRHLDTLLSSGYGDMFWMYGCAGLYYACSDQLRPKYKAMIRDAWKHRTPYRGDTENHFLMYYGSLLLMSQGWPDLADTEWFMGKSSHEIYAESVEYLDHWIDETVRQGTTEWSSPRYAYYYITPLLLLAEYTKDARLKHRFEMMLEYMLADYAIDYLNGAYCGAHSRVSDEAALNPWSAEINAYGQFFFEDSVTHVLPDLAFAAMTSFQCPKIIRDIAHDREAPYEQYSLKRGRQMIRYMDEWSATDTTHDSTFHAPVYKYEYMTKDYCLGSMQGGIVQPIQQQSWSLVINSDKPNNVITGLHPYVSADELGMFFPEYPSYQLESISKVKKGYTSEDKWVGGSPFERIYQDTNMLVALYDLPDSVRYHHIDIFVPGDARELIIYPTDTTWANTHESFFVEIPTATFQSLVSDSKNTLLPVGWKAYQVDSTLVGIWTLSQCRQSKVDAGIRLRMEDTSTGYLILCSDTRSETGEAFANRLLRLPITFEANRVCSNDKHNSIEIRLKGPRSRDLFSSPFLFSKRNSAVITVKHGADKFVLDFRK